MKSNLKQLETKLKKQLKIMRASKFHLDEISKYNSILYDISQLKERNKWKSSSKKGYDPVINSFKIPDGTILIK
jgi:hypothetical protein